MDGIRLTRSLVEDGATSYALGARERDGTLVRVRRGAWADDATSDPIEAHRRLIAATLAQIHPRAAVSHGSAGVLRELPVPRSELALVHLTRDREGGGQRRTWLQVHGHRLPVDHVEVVDGVRVTTLERTVVDLAARLPLSDGVAIGDAGLRRGATRTGLGQVLEAIGRRRGIAVARRALELLDPASESYGESVSRVVLAQHLVPPPATQVLVLDRDDELVGRADFGWPASGVVGEFDGRVKYGRALVPDRDVEEGLWSEKLREDRLRELGWLVVRWTWADLNQPEALLARLRRALAAGSGRPPPAGSWRLAARPS